MDSYYVITPIFYNKYITLENLLMILSCSCHLTLWLRSWEISCHIFRFFEQQEVVSRSCLVSAHNIFNPAQVKCWTTFGFSIGISEFTCTLRCFSHHLVEMNSIIKRWTSYFHNSLLHLIVLRRVCDFPLNIVNSNVIWFAVLHKIIVRTDTVWALSPP